MDTSPHTMVLMTGLDNAQLYSFLTNHKLLYDLYKNGKRNNSACPKACRSVVDVTLAGDTARYNTTLHFIF